MKIILLSLYTASTLMGASTDAQSVLSEVSKLRQKYEECRASQSEIKGIDPKILAEYRKKNQTLVTEINRKNGVIKSLEQMMFLRDRSYRETNARNKSLITQLHTQNVTTQEREMLKRALVAAKGELVLAQKEFKSGSSSSVKTLALQTQLNSANALILQLRSTPKKGQAQQPQVVYKDRIVTQEKVVYKDRIVAQEKVVYKDRIVTQEKVVYKDRPVEKIKTKNVIAAKSTIDEDTRRKMDKLALELERQKTINIKLSKDLVKTPLNRNSKSSLPPLPELNSLGHVAAKVSIPVAVRTKTAPAINITPPTTSSAKKSSGVYRMASNASIYNGKNGKAIDTWEARRSFTGGAAIDGWVPITGYFVNRVFQGVGEGENLWVKENDATPR